MKNSIRKSVVVLALGAATLLTAAAAVADEWPFVQGDYWEVTGIDLKDGGALKYSNWLASEWRQNLDFAKSQGWIKDFKVLMNVYGRANEADIYLLVIRETIPSGPQSEQRDKQYMAWRKKSIEQMESESGNRAEYREVLSSSLLQELNFRN